MKHPVSTMAMVIFAGLSWLCANPVLGAMQTQAPKVSYRLEHDRVSQGEPVLVDVDVSNTTQTPIDIDLGGDGVENISFMVLRPDGQRVMRQPVDGSNQIVFSGRVHLEPGQTFKEAVVLNEWTDFNGIGHYVVTLGLKSDSSSRVDLDLEVSGKNLRELELRCSELSDRITRGVSAQDSLAAAKALSYIRDPIVVPFWGKVLNRSDFGEDAAAALARVGNSAAAMALVSHLEIKDPQTRGAVRRALGSISHATNDQSLRRTIDDALRRSQGLTSE
ncbi:HEAT repeat domain-containing protein [Acidobacteria bacterium AB60]|nr:HEAT repeat domain-containing protein [Acidobacteria bacterium AB60]